MENSHISWTDHTFNPWIGCTKVSAGCTNCYAEALMDKRYGKVKWGPQGTRQRTSADNWKKPLQWNRKAEKEGIRYRVFCSSLADVFEDNSQLTEWRTDLFNLIEQTPNLDWLLLTKRPQHVFDFVPANWLSGLPDNVWMGTSVENQEQAEKRIPDLIRIPAKVLFLSCEPLLGPVNLTRWLPEECLDCDDYMLLHREEGTMMHEESPIHWVIVGGESGSNARTMHPDWARSLRDQCQAAEVAFHFKQWGEWVSAKGMSANLTVGHVFNDGYQMIRVGKHNAGRLLDDRTWDEFPETQA